MSIHVSARRLHPAENIWVLIGRENEKGKLEDSGLLYCSALL